jgi:acyl-coenzyme A thioesterase PaaI-like protein
MSSAELPRRTSRQIHHGPFDVPPRTRQHFERNAISASLLSSDAYEPTGVWSRLPGSPNALLDSTLHSATTLPHVVNLGAKKRRELPPAPPLTGAPLHSEQPDLIALVQLGGMDVCSYPGMLHGGMISTLFDEALHATVYHCLDTHPYVDTPTMVFTVQLNVKLLKPVKVPGLVVIRCWCTAMSGKKCWTRAELLQEDGVAESGGGDPMARLRVMASCDALWLQSPSTKL